MTHEDELIHAGWTVTRNGRWTHPELGLAQGRRRAFTMGEALTLLQADNTAGVDSDKSSRRFRRVSETTNGLPYE